MIILISAECAGHFLAWKIKCEKSHVPKAADLFGLLSKIIILSYCLNLYAHSMYAHLTIWSQ